MRVNGRSYSRRNPANVVRDAEWVFLYRDGKTLQEIGDKYGFSREYVRQQLAKLGLTSIDGGLGMRSLKRAREQADVSLAKAAKKEAKCFASTGMSIEQFLAVSPLKKSDPNHPLMVYRKQRSNARRRGIKWDLSFADWWRIWQESGRWDERGRGRGYCMARWADDGPYSVENIYICTGAENASHSYIVHPASERMAKAAITRAARSSPAPTKVTPDSPTEPVGALPPA